MTSQVLLHQFWFFPQIRSVRDEPQGSPDLGRRRIIFGRGPIIRAEYCLKRLVATSERLVQSDNTMSLLVQRGSYAP